MKLSLLIPSRGSPEQLRHVIRETDARVKTPGLTTIVVALDHDDASNPEPPETRCRLIWSVSAREDSLGAKYNRCQRLAPAEGYVMGADDNLFTTEDWDERLRQRFAEFGDGLGFVYFGRLDGTLPTQFLVPHALVAAQGFFFPAHFPFWFHDTWTDEIAHLTGRIVWAEVAVEEIGGRGKSRGLREVVFWAELFEALRAEREVVGDALSARFNPSWLQTQLLQRKDLLRQFFASRTARLRHPATAIQFEQRMSHDAPADARYRRIKTEAEALRASRAA